MLGLGQKNAGLGIKSTTFDPTGTKQTLLIACSSVYVRTTRSRSLAHVDKLSNAERKRDQGDFIRRGSWVMGSLFGLAVLGLVHRFEAEMAIVSLFG